MSGLKQLAVLTGMAAREALRQPICILLTTTCVALTALTPMLLMHNFGEEGKLARDSGLALHFVIGLFVAGHAACSLLSREIRSGTASVALSKPIGRSVFLVSKLAGVAAAVLFFSFCSSLGVLMSERVSERLVMSDELVGYVTDWRTGWTLLATPFAALGVAGFVNWRTGRAFESAAALLMPAFLLAAALLCGFFDRTGNFDPFNLMFDWRIAQASFLITAGLFTLACVALALSTRLSAVPAISCVCALFVAGLMWDHLFGNPAAPSALKFTGGLVPNLQRFWMVDALTGNGNISWLYTAGTCAYAVLYGVGMTCVASALFRHTEIK